MNPSIKIYADENISHGIVHGIRNRGIDIISCWEAGMISKSDLEQIEFAKKQYRVIITHDTDFLILHKKGISHSGVIYIHPKKRCVKF
ncbi:MAG: DUF5615 family PIN-like protein [Saprospiraceae bacterium]|nr:DUF5615 family PIN-like protein [Saprospiraceae bacterium]